MKRLNFLIFIFVAITALSCNSTNGPNNINNIIDEPYDFPLRPGMPEWANLKTGVEKLNALQIPEDILNRMTTRSLVETCLDYPMFMDIMANNFPLTEGIKFAIANFNGFTELLKRPDAYTYLSEKFLSFDPLAVNNEEWSLIEKGGYTFRPIKIELLLAQDAILESINYERKIILLNESLVKYEKMLTLTEYYSVFNYESLFLFIAKTLLKSGNPNVSSMIVNNNEISILLESGRLTGDVVNDIISILNVIGVTR